LRANAARNIAGDKTQVWVGQTRISQTRRPKIAVMATRTIRACDKAIVSTDRLGWLISAIA
jgi:hypothetical protein